MNLLRLFLVSSFALLFTGCLGFLKTPDEQEIRDYFAPLSPPTDRFIQAGETRLHFVEVLSDSKTTILFVHGSPGTWDNFMPYLRAEDLRESFHMISVDRPGFGLSNPGETQPSMAAQARAILQILETLPDDQIVLIVGHSLAGPVIAEMALIDPDRIDGLLFVGASMDPELEKTKWIQYPAQWPIIRSLIPEPLRVSNEEILPLKAQLVEQAQRLENIRIPVVVLQGGEDTLVPPGNATYLVEKLTGTLPVLKFHEELNHFIPFTHPELLKESIRELNELVKKQIPLNG